MGMKCKLCGKEIPEDQEMEITGIAEVTGETTLKEFFEHGVYWISGASWNERILCPHCNEYTLLEIP